MSILSEDNDNTRPPKSPESDHVQMTADRMAAVWIQTWSGEKFHPFFPNPAEVKICDIAHALSNICRFTGHTDEFYSVAQHCVLVSEQVPLEHAFAALLHDASEAYLSDIAMPVKPWLLNYRQVELNLMLAISLAFDFDWPPDESIHQADMRLQATEARDLMGGTKFDGLPDPYPFKIEPWEPKKARSMFMRRFKELAGPDAFEPISIKYE